MIFLVSDPLQHWNYKCMPPYMTFYACARTPELMPSCFCDRHFTTWGISTFSTGYFEWSKHRLEQGKKTILGNNLVWKDPMHNPKHPINNSEEPCNVQCRHMENRVLFNKTGTRTKEKPRWWTTQALLRALCFMTLARTAGKLPTRQGISNQSYILWSVSNAASHTGTSFSTWWVDVLFPSPFSKQLSNSRSPKAGCLTTFIHIYPHLLSLSHSLKLPGFSHVSQLFFFFSSPGEHNTLGSESEISHQTKDCQIKVQMSSVRFQLDNIFSLGLLCPCY